MNKKFMRCLAAGLAFLALLTVLVSCGDPEHDEAEVKAAAKELIEASYEINSIYFGEGLPYSKEGSEVAYYFAVSEESPYTTEADLREATLKVYSAEYSDILFEMAFTGYSYDDGEEVGTENLIFPRYLTDGSTFLVREAEESELLPLDRTYDTGNITVTDSSKNDVTVSVPSFKNGVPDEDIELVLKKTENGWRLDTPTY